LTVSISSRGEEAVLPVDVRTVVFRIIQESLTNIIRHAGTNHADVLVVFNGNELRVRVEDGGCGFDVKDILNQRGNQCWGLLGMMERAALLGGECQVLSQPGLGTIVELIVPLKESVNDSAVVGG
jgi:signal transduction histidine kinase